MKKILLTLAAAALCTSAFAGKKVLYSQTFDQVESPEAAGWSYGGGSMTIASDEYSKFLELSLGQNNGRSGQVTWGKEIFSDGDGNSLIGADGTYFMEFDFSIKSMPNNQYNSEITVFTNHAPIANNIYRTPWSDSGKPAHQKGIWENFVFDLSQCNTAVDTDMLAAINAPLKATTADDGTVTYAINTDSPYTLTTGDWFTVKLEVNVNTREVSYDVTSLSGNNVTSGVMTVPETNPAAAEGEEPISMLAEGLFVLTARYACTMDFDNIKIYVETENDEANPPAIALTRLGKNAEDELDLNLRAYTIEFMDEETLHITGTNGENIEVEFADCGGAYVYETTTSGVLKAWTTSGTATSPVVEETVECVPCVLPTATATISSVQAGFAKSYTLTTDNSQVPLQPTIFIDYEFIGKSGAKIAEEGVASGYVVTLPEEGTLTVTTASFGYQAAKMTVENNVEFEVKKTYDFARLTQEEAKAAGFTTWQVLNSGSTSGFSNWTARKRLYYQLAGSEHENDEGTIVYDNVYPFGFISEDNTENVLNYSEIGVEGEDLGINVAGYELFPGIRVFAGHNVTLLEHVGVTNNATSGGNNKNIEVLGLDETDFVVANTIGSYGSNSNHPICANNDEYYAQLAGADNVYSVAAVGTLDEETNTYTVTVPVYRIDTVCTLVTVFKQLGDAVEGIEAEEVAGDNYFYTIDGIRLDQPNRPGLYIHNGKKIIVK